MNQFLSVLVFLFSFFFVEKQRKELFSLFAAIMKSTENSNKKGGKKEKHEFTLYA